MYWPARYFPRSAQDGQLTEVRLITQDWYWHRAPSLQLKLPSPVSRVLLTGSEGELLTVRVRMHDGDQRIYIMCIILRTRVNSTDHDLFFFLFTFFRVNSTGEFFSGKKKTQDSTDPNHIKFNWIETVRVN